jgi:hypothetical protein
MERALSFQSPFFVCIAGTNLQGYAMNGPADSQSIGKCGRIEKHEHFEETPCLGQK